LVLNNKGLLVFTGFILGVLVYTQAKLLVVDAALVGLMCIYITMWIARRVPGNPPQTGPQTWGSGKARSRVLYYARLGNLRRDTRKSFYASPFEQSLFEALSSGADLEDALSLAVTHARSRSAGLNGEVEEA
jgi:hypothetical protein